MFSFINRCYFASTVLHVLGLLGSPSEYPGFEGLHDVLYSFRGEGLGTDLLLGRSNPAKGCLWGGG